MKVELGVELVLMLVAVAAAQCEFARVDCIASCGCIWCWDGVDSANGVCAKSNVTVCANYEPGACTWPPTKQDNLVWMVLVVPMVGIMVVGIVGITVWKRIKYGVWCDEERFIFDCGKC